MLASVLAILALVISAVTHGKVDPQAEDVTYRAYRVLIHGILVLCLIVMLAGDRIVWINCATGFAWRTWLFLYMLPSWFAASGLQAVTKVSRQR
jgi:hypothetical protein